MNRLQRELATAKRHVVRGREIVEQQRERVVKMRAGGHATVTHEELLKQFERTLKALEDHERLLVSEIAETQIGMGEKSN